MFFDIPVSRGWVPSLHTLPYTGHNDPNKDGNVSSSYDNHDYAKLITFECPHAGECPPAVQEDPH